VKKSFLKPFALSLSVIGAMSPLAGNSATNPSAQVSAQSTPVQQNSASTLVIQPADNPQAQFAQYYHSSHSSHSSHASHCSAYNSCRTP